MIFSLVRVLFFVALVVLLTLSALWLMQADGGVVVAVADVEFTLGPLQAVIAALLFVLVVWLVFKLLSLLVATVRFLNGDETAITRYFSRRSERKGFEALADGMLALAAGEGRVAMSKASRAERYLHRPELTNLITAQAAEMTGDRARAEQVYRDLVTDDRTRFVGIRGLMRQRLEAGDTDTALKLAEKAFALKPKHEETQDLLLRLQAEHSDWAGARRTLGAKLRYGALPRDVHRRRDAVLALGEAREVVDEGKTIEAREAAIEANRLSPDLVPAAVMAARAYIEQGKPRYAARVIRKAWNAQPHPDLAAAYAEIHPEETPAERIRRFQNLTRLHPDHPETRMLLSELHIANEDFPAARRALGDLAVNDPTARALTNMAAIERGEGAEDRVVRAWLARALTARRGPQWVCDKCHGVHGEWAPVCDMCGGFDTLSWREAPAGKVALPAGVEMMPLLVDPRADTAESPAAEAAGTPETEVPPAEVVEDEPRVTDAAERKD
ncbi:heme biosynthesis protein HemY [Roseitranquillus sediminis]|uniref:heme biosynthesis protein HemY n=1 Tax=Roseitranquillus sediminis TaxID=2809051 RepID=UPI001D0C06FF|nr:heme biosynthesis HemY N-terminal domain-containing protein [Roseitranquillus sediminis]MBM9596172.1 heme biosynthesis protein HemY [Roseitranquillus sediminis]